MRKLPLAVTAVVSVLVALATGAVAQKALPEVPLAIVCWNEQAKTFVVGNLPSKRMALAPMSGPVDGFRPQ